MPSLLERLLTELEASENRIKFSSALLALEALVVDATQGPALTDLDPVEVSRLVNEIEALPLTEGQALDYAALLALALVTLRRDSQAHKVIQTASFIMGDAITKRLLSTPALT